MRSLKKLLAVVVAICVLATFTIPAFAADSATYANADQAQKLYDMGLYAGTSATVFTPDLGSTLTREQGVVILLKMFGQLDAANAMTDADATAALAAYTDASQLSSWANKAMAYAVKNSIVSGTTTTTVGPKGTFTGNMFATLILKEAGYTVADFNKAAEDLTAKGVVGATALATKVLTRDDLVGMAFGALTVNNAAGKTIVAALVDAGKVTSAAAVAAGVYTAVPATFEVSSVSAVNLKEVDVKFNQAADKTTAENKDNYSLATGTVDTAALQDDGVTVRLTLVSSITNQKDNKISIKNVKAGTLTLVEVKDKVFTPIDNTLPTVSSVTPLGSKAIKLVFSEPIQTAPIGSFKIDGKAFYGSPSIASREVVLTPYDSSAMTAGEHTLTVAGVVDYYGLKSLSSEFKYSVVADTTKPTITDVTATLEKVTITFSEDIDPDSVNNDNIYWKSGSDKIKSIGHTKVAGNKYDFDFTGKALPAYETTLYVEGIKDYSGNVISETTKPVKAVVDQTRPEVTDVKAADDKLSFTVKFNKKIQATSNDAKYFTVTDKDSKVKSIKSVDIDTDNKVLTVNMYGALPEGTDTIKISGIQDATTLKNTMLDYTTTLTIADAGAPEVSTVSTSAVTRRVIITFNEKMDSATLANSSNYIITWKGVQRQVPSDTEFTVIQDSKAILITFPEKIGSDAVTFGGAGLTAVQVMGVKDVAGNMLKDFLKVCAVGATDNAAFAQYSTDYAATIEAAITGKNEIKVKFDKGIAKAAKADFTVTGDDNTVAGAPLEIDSVSVDNSDTVVIKTTKDIDQNSATPLAIDVVAGNAMQTVAGEGVNVDTIAAAGIIDLTAPEVMMASGVTKYAVANAGADATITVPFNEDLDNVTVGLDALMGDDLTVTRVSDAKVLKNTLDYTTAIVGTRDLVITVKDAVGGDSQYTVAIKSDAKYIRDLSAAHYNYAASKDAVAGDVFIDLASLTATITGTYGTATAGSITKGENIIVTFNDVVDPADVAALTGEFTAVFADPGAAATGFTTVVTTVAGKTKVTITAQANYVADTIVNVVGAAGVLTLTAANLTDDAGNEVSGGYSLDFTDKTASF